VASNNDGWRVDLLPLPGIDPKDTSQLHRVDTGRSRHREESSTVCVAWLLEPGEKSALVICDDACIDETVNAAVFGSLLYQRQLCMSTDASASTTRSPMNRAV